MSILVGAFFSLIMYKISALSNIQLADAVHVVCFIWAGLYGVFTCNIKTTHSSASPH
jgi:hypothetical protein